MCKQFRRELFRQTTFCYRNLQFLNHCLVISPLVGYATLKNFLYISSSLGACHLLLLWPWPLLSLLGAKPLYLDCAIFIGGFPKPTASGMCFSIILSEFFV